MSSPRRIRVMLLVAAALVVGCADCFSTSPFPVSPTRLSQPRVAALQNSRPLSARSYHARKQPGICSLAAQDVSVTLQRPLGIVFEEVVPGEAEGVVVAKIEPGSNADKDGKILVGDKVEKPALPKGTQQIILISTSAVVMDDSNSALVGLGGSGAKTNWTRKMIPVGKATFQTIMGAIGSNTGRWGYTDVRLTLRRTENSVPRSTESIVRERGGEAADDTELPLATPKDDWQE